MLFNRIFSKLTLKTLIMITTHNQPYSSNEADIYNHMWFSTGNTEVHEDGNITIRRFNSQDRNVCLNFANTDVMHEREFNIQCHLRAINVLDNSNSTAPGVMIINTQSTKIEALFNNQSKCQKYTHIKHKTKTSDIECRVKKDTVDRLRTLIDQRKCVVICNRPGHSIDLYHILSSFKSLNTLIIIDTVGYRGDTTV